MVTSFPVPAFFIAPDKPGDAFQALDHLTGSGKIGFELSNPTLERFQGIGGWYFTHLYRNNYLKYMTTIAAES
jgi:hypothetical protein